MLSPTPSDQRASRKPTRDTDGEVSVLNDLNGMSVAAYHSQPHRLNLPQPKSGEASQQSLSRQLSTANDLFSDHSTDLGFENWLAYGNLAETVLRDWPFIIDNVDPGCTRNDGVHGSGRPVADLQRSWYTHLDNDEPTLSGDTTPLPRHNQEIDDNYRQSLHRRLQIRVMDPNLPSAEYLNLRVRAYFKRFHPVFPVIHAATFRPSRTNAVLLLSICSIGSLLTGHPDAVHRGIQLFERLNKAILSNWETLMRRGKDENFAMIQAALLGQTFGLLSGQAKHLVLVDTFHGSIVAWARRAKIFQERHQPSEHQNLESRWREWALSEERTRLALAVRIHDAEVANTLHHETLLPLTSRKTPVADSDALFFASSPQAWMALSRGGALYLATPSSETSTGHAVPETIFDRLLSIPTDCHFSIYSAMEDVLSATMEARMNETLTDEYARNLHSRVVECGKQYLQTTPPKDLEALHGGIIVLWHLVFISINTDVDLLERGIGRGGPELEPSDLAETCKWARSVNAKRTVAHAMMIKRHLEHFPLTSEPAIHVPRALFISAISLFCYFKYNDGGAEQRLDFPEFQLLDINVQALLREANAHKHGSDEELGSVFEFIDLLQRIGHWGISRKFATILGELIHAETSS
ncbi:hypothetical protein OHC33_009429 [Knufia fluminis]|uniref:Xylanolytic transcriptional activator regulatory domain-containing protein n=1 Tax=Knufia fluminis TaxID=191047 RepID=A0AAN8I1Q9_9EURO|nr:hypothetical protein OHC33_009429 [Knufia fluminis]